MEKEEDRRRKFSPFVLHIASFSLLCARVNCCTCVRVICVFGCVSVFVVSKEKDRTEKDRDEQRIERNLSFSQKNQPQLCTYVTAAQ